MPGLSPEARFEALSRVHLGRVPGDARPRASDPETAEVAGPRVTTPGSWGAGDRELPVGALRD